PDCHYPRSLGALRPSAASAAVLEGGDPHREVAADETVESAVHQAGVAEQSLVFAGRTELDLAHVADDRVSGGEQFDERHALHSCRQCLKAGLQLTGRNVMEHIGAHDQIVGVLESEPIDLTEPTEPDVP